MTPGALDNRSLQASTQGGAAKADEDGGQAYAAPDIDEKPPPRSD